MKAYALRFPLLAMLLALAGAMLLIDSNAPAQGQTNYVFDVRAEPAHGGTVAAAYGSTTVPAASSFTLTMPSTTTQVVITAAPAADFSLAGWANCPSASGLTCTVSLSGPFTAPLEVVAYFVSSTRTLTLTGGGGSLTPSPSGISTTSASGLITYVSYPYNRVVTVTATPDTGYRFDSWSGACTGSGACSVTMSANRYVRANFVRQYTLTTAASPPAGGTVTGGGAFDWGAWTTLTATPNAGYTFGWWENGTCSSSNPCEQRVIRDRTTTAHFVPHPVITTAVSPVGAGSVTGAGTYAPDAPVTLVASPNSGYSLSGWTATALLLTPNPDYPAVPPDPTLAQWLVACTDDSNCEFSASGNVTVTANFVSWPRLTTSASPSAGGTVSGSGLYAPGTEVTVTATQNTGYVFSSWSGACTGTGACVVTLTADTTVTANFVRSYTLTVTANPAGASASTFAGNGVAISGGSASYADGTVVTVTLTRPAGGFLFSSWGGDCSGTGTCTVTMDQDRTVTVTFSSVPFYTVNVLISPPGAGEVTGGGRVNVGTTAMLTATPNANYRFLGWRTVGGEAFTGCTSGNTCGVITSDTSIVASFRQTYTITTAASPPAGGSVAGAGTYDVNTQIALTATANTNYRFVRWDVSNNYLACLDAGPVCSEAFANNRAVTAYFVLTYRLGVTASGGTISDADGPISGGARYDDGTVVTLTATPDLGYSFSGWSGDCTGSGTCTVTMSRGRAVTATFASGVTTYELTATASPSGAGAFTFSPPGRGTSDINFNAGTVVTVTVEPALGYAFTGWSDDCTGTGTCSVTMTANRAVTAAFTTAAIRALTTTASPTEGGTVEGGGNYNDGTVVEVTATPATGYRFDAWSGACTGSGACSVTMSEARTVTATFVRAYRVRVLSTGGGILTGDGIYDHGTMATITATPRPGFTWAKWSGALCGPDPALCFAQSVTFEVTSERVFRANFDPIPGWVPPAPPPPPAPMPAPAIVRAGAGLTLTPRIEGEAPDEPSASLRYSCTQSGAFDLAASDESRRFPIEAGETCTLMVSGDEELVSVSGRINGFPFTTDDTTICVFSLEGASGDLFANRVFAPGEYLAEVVFDYGRPTPTEEFLLSRGFTFLAWPGETSRIGDALGAAASVVTAVYSWDAAGQRWLSWFPGGDALGVNTLTHFETGGVYAIFTTGGVFWRVEVDEDWRPPSSIRIMRGFTFLEWPGEESLSLVEALDLLEPAVTAVYSWDAEGQIWLALFPEGAGLGVNTLSSLDPGGIYVIVSGSTYTWRVGEEAAVADESGDAEEEELPAC